MIAHARYCNGPRPSRPLDSGVNNLSIPRDADLEAAEGNETAGLRNILPDMADDSGRPSPGFLAPLIAAEGRSSMLSHASIPGSSTPGSAAAQTLDYIMHQSSNRADN